MHAYYYDVVAGKVLGWKELAAPSERFPYGLGLDNEAFLRSLDIYPYEEKQCDFNPLTEELAPDSTPMLEGEVYVRHYRPRPLAPEAAYANLAKAVRDERDKRLASTDYLMATDYPLSAPQRTAWEAYRQTLRDMSTQAGFPWAGPNDTACPWPVRPV